MGLFGEIMRINAQHRENELNRAQHQQTIDEAKRQHDFAEQIRVLDVDRKARGQLDEIYSRFGGDPNDPTNKGDPKQLGAAIDDFAKAYSIETRNQLPQDLIKVLKEPQFGKDMLQYSNDQGMTMGQVFAQGASPMMRLQGRLAIAKHMDTLQGQKAQTAGTEPMAGPAPVSPQANASPNGPALGSGLQIPGSSGPGFMPVSVAAGGSAPAPAAAPQAAALPPAASAPASDAMPKALTPELQTAANALQAQITNLTKNINTVANKTPESKALPLLNDRLKTLQEHLFQLTGKSAQGQAEAEAQLGRSIVPPQVLKETGLPAGTVQRDLTRPGAAPATMLTPEQTAGITHSATAAGTELTDVIHQGNVARQTVPMLDVAIAASTRAGITGPLVTPVREAVMKVGNLFGVATQGQTALQLIDAITPRLAVQLTSQMKGQQSDREFLAGVQSAANKGQTNQAFSMVAYFTRELGALAIEKERQARIWTANREHPGLNIPDKQGRTFQEVFDASVEKVNSERGTIGERASRAFNVPYKDVLKGSIGSPKRGG